MDYLRRIGLRETDAAKYPDQLSGGMQQRVAIAQALLTRPRILLMDEAFSALDPGTRKEMQRLIRDLWQETGTTIVFRHAQYSRGFVSGLARDRAGERDAGFRFSRGDRSGASGRLR